jgi:hypothetical protein
MRFALCVITLSSLLGCASTEYSNVPEPSGDWVPANPSRFAGDAPQGQQQPMRLDSRTQGGAR